MPPLSAWRLDAAQERGWRSLIVVTDAFHTRRAASNPRYDPQHWWRSESGLVSVSSELLKLGFYWLKYGVSPF